jgi:hypothetical protein
MSAATSKETEMPDKGPGSKSKGTKKKKDKKDAAKSGSKKT